MLFVVVFPAELLGEKPYNSVQKVVLIYNVTSNEGTPATTPTEATCYLTFSIVSEFCLKTKQYNTQ